MTRRAPSARPAAEAPSTADSASKRCSAKSTKSGPRSSAKSRNAWSSSATRGSRRSRGGGCGPTFANFTTSGFIGLTPKPNHYASLLWRCTRKLLTQKLQNLHTNYRGLRVDAEDAMAIISENLTLKEAFKLWRL